MAFPRIDALIALAGSGGLFDYFASPLLDSSTHILAADGGVSALAALGHRPHMLVGDMDSLPATYGKEALGEGAFIRFPVDKDYTDGELATAAAVMLASGRSPKDSLFREADGGQGLYSAFQKTPLSGLTLAYLNFGGYRYDHFLANINLASLLAQRGAQVFLTDGTSLARILVGPARLSPVFDPTVFDRASQVAAGRPFQFSLLPLDDEVRGLTLAGLKWDLDRVDLTRGRSLTLSNRARGLYPDQVDLSLERGKVMALTFPEGL